MKNFHRFLAVFAVLGVITGCNNWEVGIHRKKNPITQVPQKVDTLPSVQTPSAPNQNLNPPNPDSQVHPADAAVIAAQKLIAAHIALPSQDTSVKGDTGGTVADVAKPAPTDTQTSTAPAKATRLVEKTLEERKLRIDTSEHVWKNFAMEIAYRDSALASGDVSNFFLLLEEHGFMPREVGQGLVDALRDSTRRVIWLPDGMLLVAMRSDETLVWASRTGIPVGFVRPSVLGRGLTWDFRKSREVRFLWKGEWWILGIPYVCNNLYLRKEPLVECSKCIAPPTERCRLFYFKAPVGSTISGGIWRREEFDKNSCYAYRDGAGGKWKQAACDTCSAFGRDSIPAEGLKRQYGFRYTNVNEDQTVSLPAEAMDSTWIPICVKDSNGNCTDRYVVHPEDWFEPGTWRKDPDGTTYVVRYFEIHARPEFGKYTDDVPCWDRD